MAERGGAGAPARGGAAAGGAVRGVRAASPPSTDTYKGLVCTPAGYAGEARIAYPWPDAEAKARAALAFLRKRAQENGVPVEEWREEYFGVNAFGGPTVNTDDCEPPEVIGRLAWRTADYLAEEMRKGNV